MSALALRNYVPQEDETRPTSLTDLLHVPEKDRQATIQELGRRADALIDALCALRRDARKGGVDLESALRDIRREERELSESIRRVAENPRRGVLDAAQLEFLEKALRVDGAVLDAYRECREELETLRRQRLGEYHSEWLEYLSKLREKPDYAALALRVEEFWDWVSGKLWAPEATPTDEGFLLVWDRDEHHLQVEFFQDGSYDWFYRNRDNDGVSSEEGLPFGRWTARFKAAISALRGL
jgi:hypothetical protein